MDFNEYQQSIEEFVVYPREQWAGYLSLALMGECGEIANVMKKEMRNDEDYSAYIMDEAGDILFYLARLNSEVGISFQTIYVSSKSTTKHIGNLRGKLRELIKKSVDLDNLLSLSGNNHEVIYIYTADILHWLIEIVSAYGADIDEVMLRNLEKLSHRKQENNLKHV